MNHISLQNGETFSQIDIDEKLIECGLIYIVTDK